MKRKHLNPEENRFILAYRETSNANEAYRRAYDKPTWTAASINRSAKRVMARPVVAARLAKLEAEDRARCAVTVDSITGELDAAYMLALWLGQPAAAVAALMGKAKLHGLGDGQRPEPQNPGTRPAVSLDTPSKWAAMKAEIEATNRRTREELKAGNGADGNAPSSDTRH